MAELAERVGGRVAMESIMVEDNQAWVTDGYLLGTMALDAPNGKYDADLIRKAKVNTKKQAEIEIKDDMVVLSQPDKSVICKPENKGHYPLDQSKRLLQESKDDSGGQSITLSVQTLDKVLKMMKKSGEEHITLTPQVDSNKAVYAKSGGIELLIMPVKKN